jgi:hypothetical protein
VLADAGLDVTPDDVGRSPYIEMDAYWQALR